MTGQPLFKRILNKIKKRVSRTVHDRDGVAYYTRSEGANAGLQTYYADNIVAIHSGVVPDRYKRIAALTPGDKVIEFGAADGTQSLVLALEKERVWGVELMDLQIREAEKLKADWLSHGFRVENCRFVQRDILEASDLLADNDTVVMSRVLYHLRGGISDVMDTIAKSAVRHVVLVGCPKRTERWRKHGETGDAMGKYAYYATLEGMSSVLREQGFTIVHAIGGDDGEDPVVVGSR